ncbi:MAG: hypothetical protein EPO51_01580 [Phenylobacterium sp.]|uniref:hypothetical protein n=1 Tax=Phenylobacterium sp. TaxID=1871053 RepID=UPI00122649C1|nr:hypothetical protein [Phenylobacterium sp.]TAJ74776.1 MAG: hypothetical protein EPO51_01580 [Phenylobacterium sp.]
MLAGLRQILVNPATGLVAIGVAVALAVGLGVTSANWRAQQADYEARIAELTRASEKAEAGFRMELASCQAVGEARETLAPRVAAAGGTPAGARRLLEQQPEGIDACARMESADQAVLSNLKK